MQEKFIVAIDGPAGAGKSTGHYCQGGAINVRTAIAHRGMESEKASRT